MKIINIGIKILLLVLFIIAVTFYIPNLEGKGMVQRFPLFVGSIFVVPLIYKFSKWNRYPHVLDILIVLPFLLDTIGNFLGLFDSLPIFDKALHFLNWTILVLAFQNFKANNQMKKIDSFLIGSGFGALTIVFWEALEWAISVDGFGIVSALNLSYEDTIADLVLSNIGGMLGAYIGTILWGQHSPGNFEQEEKA